MIKGQGIFGGSGNWLAHLVLIRHARILFLRGDNSVTDQIESESATFDGSTIRIQRDTRGRAACVVEGTRVLLKDGHEKPIEDIQPFTADKAGDELMYRRFDGISGCFDSRPRKRIPRRRGGSRN